MAATTTTATLASWNGQSSTIPAFIKSLFAPSVRNETAVKTAIQAGDTTYSFTDATTRGMILNAWLAAWQQHNGDPCNSAALAICPSLDLTLIGYLSDYIKANSLSMCIPTLNLVTPQPSSTTLAVYKNSGYVPHQFLTNGKWNYGTIDSSGQYSTGDYVDETVSYFLFQLFHGAHFVVVSNAADLQNKGGPPQFWEAFAASNLDTSADKFNSHYSGLNLTGYYYLDVRDDEEPEGNPLLVAFLAGLTNPAELSIVTGTVAAAATVPTLVLPPVAAVNAATASVILIDTKSRRSSSNTFIQLEGWQNHEPYFWSNDWHGADYHMHTDTKWNFSTFGGCAYSEKRSTPIFLANANFPLAINSSTQMPLYDGASSWQMWMNTGLLQT